MASSWVTPRWLGSSSFDDDLLAFEEKIQSAGEARVARRVLLVADIVEQTTQDPSQQVLHVVPVLDVHQRWSPGVADGELAHRRGESAQYTGDGGQRGLAARAGVREPGPD